MCFFWGNARRPGTDNGCMALETRGVGGQQQVRPPSGADSPSLDPKPELNANGVSPTVKAAENEAAGQRWGQFSAADPVKVAATEGEPPFLDPDAGEKMGWADAAGLAADVAGIFDPTPISDGVSGVLSLGKGDFLGAGLSVASMVPYLGDAVAKPAKFASRIMDAFPALARVVNRADGITDLAKTLQKVGPDAGKLNDTLRSLNNVHDAAEAAYKNEKWLAKAKDLQLPTDGPIAFVPPKGWDPKNPKRGPNHGYVDAYGNEWTKGPSRTAGESFEWDVQLRKQNSGLANLSRDGSHLNVSLSGTITHK